MTILAASIIVAFAAMLTPALVLADEPNIGGSLGCGSSLDVSINNDCSTDIDTGSERIQGIVTIVINTISVIVGIVAVIMIIWGGFKYITAGGDAGNVTTARNTIIYAIVGLVIVALAQFIVQFVLKQLITE